MQKIKFRCWDKNKKQMRAVRELCFDQYGTIDVYCECDDINEPAKGNDSLMQFTGLLDRHGKEIYEGDILNLYCSSNKKHVVSATVEWLGVSFHARIHNKKVIGGNPEREVEMWEMHQWAGAHDCLTGWPKNLEIIGNIYENPELFK